MGSFFRSDTKCLFVFSFVFFTFFNPKLFAQVNSGAFPFAWKVEPFFKYREDGKPGRAITLLFKKEEVKGPVRVKVICNRVTETTSFDRIDSSKRLLILLPPDAGVDTAATAVITIQAGSKEYTASIPVPAAKQWTVFIYPHSHVDIGYTGLQEDVEKIHVRNIDVGIDLARKTQNYPEGSRFIWNTEVTWAVDAYLKKATAEQKRSFFDAVKKGWIQIDAGHSNINTSTCSDEELMRFFKNSNAIEKQTGIPITTLVQVDNPGAAWGLVQAAAENGVTGFVSFPNNYDLRKVFEHKPFYWRAPDGKSKILFLQGYPYGIGYTIKGNKYGLSTLQTYSEKYDRVSTSQPLQNFVDRFLFKETARLENEHSPYDFFVMTWSMADNCVIDADLPEAVRQWNEHYAYPKLVIAGAKEILSAYEKKYRDIIPEYSGDFTEFWTNGLGSDAVHVGMGRRAKENLVQAETLSALTKSVNFSHKKLDSAWENILLSAEHTWGYQNPKEPMAKVIEKRKASFFSDAEEQSITLLKTFGDANFSGGQFAVMNTLSWDRGGIVTLSAEQSKNGDRVIEMSSGREVPSQRLSTGELLFYANTIPALASRMYKVVQGTAAKDPSLSASATALKNNLLSVSVDPVTGAINSIVDRKTGYEFVSEGNSLNSFHYLPGVFNGKDKISGPVSNDSATVVIKEDGPLQVSLLIRCKAAGTNWLQREVKLYAGQPFIQIKNTFDKIGTRKKEGVHFGFAFNLPGAVSHMDAPWSVIVPEKDQLTGANRNWMSFQRWIDISNDKKGVTWTAIESPLVEWGEMSGTILDGARQYSLWKKTLGLSQTLYSWTLNNHWDTNFPLEQSGIMVQQYAVLFHGNYDPAVANRFGTEQHRPLIAIPAQKNLIERSIVRISNPRVVLSSLKNADDRNGIVLRLRSISAKKETVPLTWPANTKPGLIKRCNAEGQSIETTGDTITLMPYGTETIYVRFKNSEKILENK